MSTLSLSRSAGAVDVLFGRAVLMRYVFRPDMPDWELPRPHAHPVRTLGGTVVTAVRPADHPWHAGIGMAIPDVGGANFWGGPTYVDGQGYVDLADRGRIEHRGWCTLTANGETAELAEDLHWADGDGRLRLTERRELVVRDIDPAGGRWTLGWSSRLRNASGGPLVLRSPAVNGRAGAGYGGFFWRGAAAFRGGEVTCGNGDRTDRLTFRGRDAEVTFSSVSSSGDRWFVRNAEYPGVCAALAFAEPCPIAAGDELSLACRVEITDRVRPPAW